MDSRQQIKERTFEDLDPTIEWERDPANDILKVYLPGFRKEQLKVQVTTTRLLRISGERELGENKGIKFRKEIPISSNYDTNDISAKFERGILFVKHPKSIIPDRKPQPPLEKPASTPPKDAPKPPKPPQPKRQQPPQEKSKQSPPPPPPPPKVESPKPEISKIEPKAEPDAAKIRSEGKTGGEVNKNEQIGEKERKKDEIAAGITKAKLGDSDSVCGNVGSGEKVAAGVVTGVQRLNYRKMMEPVITVLLILILWIRATVMKPIRYFRNSHK